MVKAMTRHFSLPIVYVLTLLFLGAATPRLEAHTPGFIEGVVTSASGAPMAHVDVVVDNVITGASYRAQTDAKGHYLLAKLNPGRYELRAEARHTGCVIISQIIVDEGSRVIENIHFTQQPPPACEPARSNKSKKTT
jgi:hypothetical protein